MKEVLGIAGLTPDKIKTIEQIVPVKEEKILQRVKPQPGQKAWELDMNTGEIKEAEYQATDYEMPEHKKVDLSGIFKNNLGGQRTKLIQKKDCIYELAINRKNAEKKFKKRILAAISDHDNK